jgi:membrane-bound lytic murein transglycosylase D
MHRKRVTLMIVVFWVLLGFFHFSVHAAEEPFPLYPVIDPNVNFWTNIYSHYSTIQAVVHDSVHLDIVYDVIDLKPANHPGARKINRRRMKEASQSAEWALKRLAADPRAEDADCRRVAALFGPGADARTFSHARHRVRCQIGQCDRFRAGLIRSGAYIQRMRAILKSYGVPEDLAYLPHVESSFNTNAYSKFGAAGMWQFTRSTGKRFMTVDYVLDERRDPIAAARAAAQLLKENHDRLGSWPLAITAYNHGAAGMQRAKSVYGDYPEIFKSYKGRTFKFASRNFYSEFLAARRVASNFQRYFGSLALKSPVPSRRVSLDGFAAFTDLCRHFEVSPKVVQAMNPSLRPPVINGQKYIPRGYMLNLPATDESDGASLADIPLELIKRAQKPSRFYTVQKGDTAGRIARMHRVKLSDLILANNMDRRATVYARQTLRIPQAGESFPCEKLPQPATPRDPVVLLAAGKSDDTPFAIPENIPLESAIARYRRPGPSPADLIEMADIDSENAPEAAVDNKWATEPGIVNADVNFAQITQFRQQQVGIIQVEVEETLGHYAEWAGVRASRIRRLNNLPFGQPLQLHKEIKIPLDAIAAEDFKSRRYDFHKRLQEDFFAAYRVGELQRYRVQPGDSYWTLCREKFDLPLWLLRHYNTGVNLAALKIHQPLTIPAIESIIDDNPDAADGETIPEA